VIRLALRVRSDAAELVLAELLELAPAGVEEVDVGHGTIEYAVYGAPGELPRLPALKAAAGDALIEVSTSELDDDWPQRWRQFHRPVVIPAPAEPGTGRSVPGLRVRPPWEAPSTELDGQVHEIVIDPGQAFGTGAHVTTRLCLELLLELAAHEQASGTLVDVGTGSGVLAVAAARVGFAPVLALDNERESVEAARNNAAANGVQIEVRSFDLRTQPAWSELCGGPAGSPVVLANLLRPLLLELAHKLPGASHVLAGGLLDGEADEVVDAFGERLKLQERERRERGGWTAVWLASA
jgi:ribosomal protein L11 methyltransferase